MKENFITKICCDLKILSQTSNFKLFEIKFKNKSYYKKRKTLLVDQPKKKQNNEIERGSGLAIRKTFKTIQEGLNINFGRLTFFKIFLKY